MNASCLRGSLLAVLAAASLTGSAFAEPAAAKSLPRGWAAPPPRDDCASLGPGFQKAEGSDTCVRVSGSVEAGMTVRSGGGASFVPATGGR